MPVLPPPDVKVAEADDAKLLVSFDIFRNHSGPNLIESLILLFVFFIDFSLKTLFTFSFDFINSF